MFKPNAISHSCRIAIFAALPFLGDFAMALEQPDYSVVYKDADIEYRQYEPYLVAETVIENASQYSDAGNEGFRRLFRYITGSNRTQAKIAMTAPVQQAPTGEKIAMTAPVQQTNVADGWRVAFMLPTEYTLDTAPVPTDTRVQIRPIRGRLMAVLRYSGRWTERNYATKRSQLAAAIDAESISSVGDFQSALYNPPYTPPFMRRNEVMIEVSGLPAAAKTIYTEQFPPAQASVY